MDAIGRRLRDEDWAVRTQALQRIRGLLDGSEEVPFFFRRLGTLSLIFVPSFSLILLRL